MVDKAIGFTITECTREGCDLKAKLFVVAQFIASGALLRHFAKCAGGVPGALGCDVLVDVTYCGGALGLYSQHCLSIAVPVPVSEYRKMIDQFFCCHI